MQKEFVHYELAVKLKELGFDEPCFGCFNHLDKSEIWTKRTYMNGLTENITAPLYQQAFRWFREKHDKLGCIKKANDRNRFVYLVNDIVFAFYDSYEEAELACLEKLVEIVEQQNQK